MPETVCDGRHTSTTDLFGCSDCMTDLDAMTDGPIARTVTDIRDLYTGSRCSLNGHDATITGRLLTFATVAALDAPIRGQYAWLTVANVMENGSGAFRV